MHNVHCSSEWLSDLLWEIFVGFYFRYFRYGEPQNRKINPQICTFE